MALLSAPRGVLLDIDGTLVDSNGAHAAAWREALAEQEVQVSEDRLRRLIGMGADHLLPSLGLPEDADPGKAAKARKAVIFRERYLPHLRPQRGARELVLGFVDAGLTCIVATSSERDELARLLDAAGVRDLVEPIDRAATADQVDRSKPDPDVVCAAIERSGMAARELVMLGDTPYDVASAGRAGVTIVCLRCGGWDDAALAGATAIYDDPADLAAHFADSPFAPGDSSVRSAVSASRRGG